MENRFQRVALDGETFSWGNALPGIAQGSILGSLLFLIYINDLTKNISSSLKTFADDNICFFNFHRIFTNEQNKDLDKISKWANQCKMYCNPDLKKQAQEAVFTR